MALHIEQEIMLNEVRLGAAGVLADQFAGLIKAHAFDQVKEAQIVLLLADLDENVAMLKAANVELVRLNLGPPNRLPSTADLSRLVDHCLVLRVLIRDQMVKLNDAGDATSKGSGG